MARRRRNYVSTNHAILKAGLKVVFADIDDTMCLSPASVREKISERTRAVMFVGIGGNTGHYYEIVDICREHNLALILDAAHMSGTRIKNARQRSRSSNLFFPSGEKSSDGRQRNALLQGRRIGYNRSAERLARHQQGHLRPLN
ncbi:MAG: aminotransferase class V-fold PLP-dependent enzyme [Selenomonadaceae bacterium]|nr:aminotransferase class V-fold PLP-dependent enzyme [Selenomonadaceae bacterium]